MKKAISIILMFVGVILPVYILISGIIQTVNGISPFIAKEVVFGVLKIVFCEVGVLPFAIGYYIYSYDAITKEYKKI